MKITAVQCLVDGTGVVVHLYDRTAVPAATAPEPPPKSTVIDAPVLTANYNEEKDEPGGHVLMDRVGKIEIRMKIPHDGEVNRARYMPQNHFVAAL